MALVRWEPFRELAALQNEMGRWMNQMAGGATPGNGASTWLPAVDVWETESELVLSFDLPGIPEDKIAVELDDNVLTVSGGRARPQEDTHDTVYPIPGFFRFQGVCARDESLAARLVHEVERRLDLRPHAARGELRKDVVVAAGPKLREPAALLRAEVFVDGRHLREDDEPVGAERRCEYGGSAILFDHGVDSVVADVGGYDRH